MMDLASFEMSLCRTICCVVRTNPRLNIEIHVRPAQVRVRSLWEKYYADAHGLIFVIDSADVGRFEEARMAFGEWLAWCTQ